MTSVSQEGSEETGAFDLDKVDIDALTDKLWKKIRYRLRVERERSRGWT
jgi:hypothetical protein